MRPSAGRLKRTPAAVCSGDTTVGDSIDGSGQRGSNGAQTASIEDDSAGNGAAGCSARSAA